MESIQYGPGGPIYDVRSLTKTVKHGLPGEIVEQDDPITSDYDVFKVGAGAVHTPSAKPPGGSSTSKQSEEIDPARNYWYPVSRGMLEDAGGEEHTLGDLPARAQLTPPLGDYVMPDRFIVYRGIVVKRWFIYDTGQGDIYIWASEEDLPRIADKLASMAPAPDDVMPPPSQEMLEYYRPNWLAIGGVALGAAVLIGGVVYFARRK